MKEIPKQKPITFNTAFIKLYNIYTYNKKYCIFYSSKHYK